MPAQVPAAAGFPTMAIVGAVMSHDGIRVLTTTEGGASSGQDVVRRGRGSGPASRRLIAFAIEIGRLETDRSRLPGAVPRLADLVDQTRLGDRAASTVSSSSASRARSSSSRCRASRRRRTCRSRSAGEEAHDLRQRPPFRRCLGPDCIDERARQRRAAVAGGPGRGAAEPRGRSVDEAPGPQAHARLRRLRWRAIAGTARRPRVGGQHPELPRGTRPDDAPSRSAREAGLPMPQGLIPATSTAGAPPACCRVVSRSRRSAIARWQRKATIA